MKVLVIGGQAAGMTFSTRLKRNNPAIAITVVEQNDYISFGSCGLPYFIGDYFQDENELFARNIDDMSKQDINIMLKTTVTEANYLKKNITVINNDKTQVLDFDKLVLASGATPNSQNLVNEENIFNVHQLKSSKKLKDRLRNTSSIAIIGAGYIGLEMLEAITQYPNLQDIHLISNSPNISGNLLDEEFNDILLDELEKYNINIHLGVRANLTYVSKNVVQVSLSETKQLTVNTVILAIGLIPNTQLFENIPLDKLPNGAIISDTNGCTNIPDIFAIGDCATVHHDILNQSVYAPLATVANKMGRVVADYIAKKTNPLTYNYIGSSCLKILSLECAKVGLTEKEAIQHKISYKATFVKNWNHTDYYPNKEMLYMKILVDSDKIIIGAQLLGKAGAALRNHALSVAIQAKMSIDELSMLDFAYSPPFNKAWEPLNILGMVASKYSI